MKNSADYEAFLRILGEALQKQPIRILAFILMPNHWHFLVWPVGDEELTNICRWLTHTQSMRWHAHYHTSGTGHIYQGRFKLFAVQSDEHLFTFGRYVERNALRANLAIRAGHWHWSSHWRGIHGDEQPGQFLSPWPLALLDDWMEQVKPPQTEAELGSLRKSIRRGGPFGAAGWQKKMAARQGLAHTLRPRGRPPKKP